MKKLFLTSLTSLFLLTSAINVSSNAIHPVTDQTFVSVQSEKGDLPNLPSSH